MRATQGGVWGSGTGQSLQDPKVQFSGFLDLNTAYWGNLSDSPYNQEGRGHPAEKPTAPTTWQLPREGTWSAPQPSLSHPSSQSSDHDDSQLFPRPLPGSQKSCRPREPEDTGWISTHWCPNLSSSSPSLGTGSPVGNYFPLCAGHFPYLQSKCQTA